MIYILNIIIFLESFYQFIQFYTVFGSDILKIYIRYSCKFCRNQFVSLFLDEFLDVVECGIFSVDVDFLVSVFILLFENLIGTVVDELKFEFFDVNRFFALHSEVTLVVEHVVNAS